MGGSGLYTVQQLTHSLAQSHGFVAQYHATFQQTPFNAHDCTSQPMEEESVLFRAISTYVCTETRNPAWEEHLVLSK